MHRTRRGQNFHRWALVPGVCPFPAQRVLFFGPRFIPVMRSNKLGALLRSGGGPFSSAASAKGFRLGWLRGMCGRLHGRRSDERRRHIFGVQFKGRGGATTTHGHGRIARIADRCRGVSPGILVAGAGVRVQTTAPPGWRSGSTLGIATSRTAVAGAAGGHVFHHKSGVGRQGSAVATAETTLRRGGRAEFSATSIPVATMETRILPSKRSSNVEPKIMLALESTSSLMRFTASVDLRQRHVGAAGDID